MLARREHGRRELVARLIAKGCAAADAEALVVQLVTENLVSDARFVEALMHVRTRRGYGPLKIAAELRTKEIDEDLIRTWVDFSDPAWIARLSDLRVRKFGMEAPADFRARARQIRFLQGRGYTLEQIHQVMHAAAD